MTKAEILKELSALCLTTLGDDSDAKWAMEFWGTLSESELFDELADARANAQMAEAEGRWEDSGCNQL